MKLQSGRFYLQKRYLVASLAFFGWIFLYLMRTNLSICIVDMTSNRSITVDNETIIMAAEFHWSSQEKLVILSAFSWGYMTAPVGALAASRYGAVSIFGTGIAITALLTMLSPFVMSWNMYVYLGVRILEGIAEGLSGTAFLEALRVWSSPKERSRLMGMSISGYIFGIMLGYPICGTIAYYLNWKAVFHITGGAALVWSIIWFTFIRNHPDDDNMMSLQEKQFLKQFNEPTTIEKVIYLWNRILRSSAVWAYWNERFVGALSDSFLAFSLPLYIKDVHDINIQDIGFISGLPHACAAISILGGSILADVLRNRNILTISNVHRLFLSFSQFAAIVLLVTIALSEHFVTSIVCLCLFRLFFTASTVSYEVLPVDIGGKFCGLIVGFGLTAVAVSSALSSLLMGFIVTNHSATEWSIYFLVLSCFNLWGGLIFYKFGTGELQPWAVSADSENYERQEGCKNDADLNDLK